MVHHVHTHAPSLPSLLWFVCLVLHSPPAGPIRYCFGFSAGRRLLEESGLLLVSADICCLLLEFSPHECL